MYLRYFTKLFKNTHILPQKEVGPSSLFGMEEKQEHFMSLNIYYMQQSYTIKCIFEGIRNDLTPLIIKICTTAPLLQRDADVNHEC